MMVRSKVPHNFNGGSLLDYLAKRFTYLSRAQWLRRLEEGRIGVNDRVSCEPDSTLAADDIVIYSMPDVVEPPADLNYRIIYEDDWIIGVDKPGNLLVHKSGKSFTSNLAYQLRYCHRPMPYPGIDVVNRLDRETSGIVLMAKDKKSLRMMNNALADRTMEKEYIAVVHGRPPKKTWSSRGPIGKDITSSIGYKFRIDEKVGKVAQTDFETMHSIERGFSVIRARPLTGRTHQIRVHCAAAGLPIVGDKLYGMNENDFIAWRNGLMPPVDGKWTQRQALHSACLRFQHPITGEIVSLKAPLPRDMVDLIKKLEAQ
jgi:23S rRNA pseudouridine1911/1915/1917 synthase